MKEPDSQFGLEWSGFQTLVKGVGARYEGEKGFRRLKAHKQLPILRAALLRHQQALRGDKLIASKNLAA